VGAKQFFRVFVCLGAHLPYFCSRIVTYAAVVDFWLQASAREKTYINAK